MATTARGHIEQLPSGSFRVHVYAGTDPVTGQPRRQRAGKQQRHAREHRREPRFLSVFPAPPSWTACPPHPARRPGAAVTRRIIAHVRRGWPRLGEPIVRHRGQYCYVAALLPGHREPTPILRLRYQGSADHWGIGIYLASSGQYTESGLPASFGPKTSTPEQGIDDTFVLYAGPETGR